MSYTHDDYLREQAEHGTSPALAKALQGLAYEVGGTTLQARVSRAREMTVLTIHVPGVGDIIIETEDDGPVHVSLPAGMRGEVHP